MSDTQVAAQPAQPQSLTIEQAAERYAASKSTTANPVSEAARTLGQRAAAARAERRTADTQADEEQQPQPENTADATPGDTTNTEDAPPGEQTEVQDEAQDGPIDLGEGVVLTKEEIRGNILRQADYTRKTQALADDRKAFDAERSQKLSQLDEVLGVLQTNIGQPKSMKQWLAEDPISGLEKFADQQDQLGQLHAAREHKQALEQQQHTKALDLRDRELAEHYNKAWADPVQRDKDYTDLSRYALKEGAAPEHIRMLTEPWMIRVLHKAMKNDAIEAAKPGIQKMAASKPQVVKPGAKVSAQSAAHTTLQSAEAKLKATGSIAAAAEVLRLRRGG